MWIRYLCSLGFALALACLIPLALAAAPDFSTNESRLAFVEALLEKYPDIVRSNLQYRRNLMHVLKQFHELSEKLGPNLTPLGNRALSTMEMSYAPGSEIVQNEAAIKLLKKGFLSDIERLPMPELHGLTEDLRSLVSRSSAEGKLDTELYKKNVSRLVRQAPLLYDASGKPISTGSNWQVEAKARVEKSSIFDLENLYSDMFLQHQLPLLEKTIKAEEKSGLLNQVVKVQVNNLKKDVPAAARPLMKSGEAGVVRHLRLEEVLSPVDIFRGCFGKDCSILSVPYFPAVKGTKTYFVHKSKVPGSPPDGYLFVAPVEVNGKTLPYVITANGNLTAEDVQKAVQAVALDWGVDEYVRVNFTKAPNVVNSEAMRVGLRAAGGKEVQVELPGGWEEVSKFTKENGFGYSNYYAADSLKDAFVTKVNVQTPDLLAPIKRTVAQSKPLQGTGQILTRPAFDRALLAAGAVNGDKGSNLREFVMKRLEVSPAQLEAAEKLQGTQLGMHKDLFLALEKEFGFRFRDLETLDLAKWMHSLNFLHEEVKAIATDAGWARSYERVFADIIKDWSQAGNPDRVRLLDALSSFTKNVPAEHRQAGKAFIDGVVDWMAKAERFPHGSFIDLMGQNYIDAEMFKKVFPRIVASAKNMDQASVEHFTKALSANSLGWSKAEQKAAWQSWYRAVDLTQRGLTGRTLYQVPEEFRDLEWLAVVWNHSDYGNGSTAYLRYRRDLLGQAPLTSENQAILDGMEKTILTTTDAFLTMKKPVGSTFTVVAIFEVLDQPEYKAHFVSRYGNEGLKENIFNLVKSDNHGSWPRFEKFQYLQKWGWLEEYVKKEGFNGAWWKAGPQFFFAEGLAKMLKDPGVPLSTKSALRQDILKNAEQRYEHFIWKHSGDSRAYFYSLEDFKNPHFLELVGPNHYQIYIERLRKDLFDFRLKLHRDDQRKLEALLRTLVSEGPVEAAAPIFAMLDKLGWLAEGDELSAKFAARLKVEPALAAHYEHATQSGLTKAFSRSMDSCRRFFSSVAQEF